MDLGLRRMVAVIIGVLGLVILIDIMVIAIIHPEANFEGVRQVLFIIIGALLVVGGSITFAWPKRGSVETPSEPET